MSPPFPGHGQQGNFLVFNPGMSLMTLMTRLALEMTGLTHHVVTFISDHLSPSGRECVYKI